MSDDKPESGLGNWTSPSGFVGFGDKQVNFLFGSTLLSVRNIQFHVHSIDSGTLSHSHKEFQLIYYIKGSGEQVVGQQHFRVTPHTAFIIPPKKIHYFQPDTGSVAEVFSQTFELKMNLARKIDIIENDRDTQNLVKLLYEGKTGEISLKTSEIRDAGDLIEKMQLELNEKGFGYMLAVQSNLLLLLRLLLRASVSKEKEAPPPSRTQTIFLSATRWIEKHLSEQVKLSEVAQCCHVSQNYLQKIFRQFLGRSFSRYVQDMKMDHAAYLLKNTDLTIKEVAFKCGVPDRNYFSRLFKKVHGFTPKEFRNN